MAIRLPIVPPLRAYIRYFPFTFLKQALWDSVITHVVWLESDVTIKTVFGAKLSVDAHDALGRNLYYFGVWEPNLTRWIQRRLRQGDTFIDIGANIGYFSLLACGLVGDSGKVVSVEALPQIFQRLEANLKTNGVCNTRAINAAAWHREEKLKLFTQAEHPSGTTTLMHEWADRFHLIDEVEVSAKPLSLMLTNDEIKNARLIKIDVEGAEWNVISEMRSWLPCCRKDLEVIIEITCSMLKTHGKRGQDVFDIFSDLGFKAYQIENDYRTSAYINHSNRHSPKRLDRFPISEVDQYDIIFSRTDAPSL